MIYLIIFFYVTASILLLAYGLQSYILTYLFVKKRPAIVKWQRERMNYYNGITDESKYPLVLTQLPMYNEKTVAARIIDAAAVLDYPSSRHEIQVLDDSTDDTVDYVDEVVKKWQDRGVNIKVIRRVDRVGYKAGALQNGLEQTNAEFVAIFDADFVPNPDFLKKATAFFIDAPEIGLVQGRWTHLNRRASILTRAQAIGIDGHFMVEQAARSWNNLFMNFNGTAGMFRIKAIDEAGGWEHDTLTEDMDLSYRMQLKGWKTEYVPDLEVPAEIPEDINAFKNQQFRWAKGSIQTALKIVPLLRRHDIPKFKFFQALLHLTHYSVHPLMLSVAILSLPVLAFVKYSLPVPLFALVLVAMVLATGGPSTMYMVAQGYLGRSRVKTFIMIPAMMLTGIGLAVNNAKAVYEALSGKTTAFVRTPKKGDTIKHTYKPIKDLTPFFEIIVGLYCVLGFYVFFGYTNFLVTPFLAIYASGFLFTGIISIIHTKRPDLVDIKLKSILPSKSPQN